MRSDAIRVSREPIPATKLLAFHEILKACGGRYLSNPVESPDEHGHWRVDYAYDSGEAYAEHSRRWERVRGEAVREARANQPWRIFIRRVTLGLISC